MTRTLPRSSLLPGFGLGQRHAAKQIGGEFDGLHRAATFASGSEVTGVPSRSTGATKL